MTIRDHANAVLARLRENSTLASCTFEGVVTDRPNRYVTVHVSSDWEQTRFTGPQSTADFTLIVHSVGTTTEQAQMVEELVFAQLLGYTPVVPNRKCRRIRFVSAQPVQLDEDTSPPLFYAVDQFALTTDPA